MTDVQEDDTIKVGEDNDQANRDKPGEGPGGHPPPPPPPPPGG
jgi:hypothetical protein